MFPFYSPIRFLCLISLAFFCLFLPSLRSPFRSSSMNFTILSSFHGAGDRWCCVKWGAGYPWARLHALLLQGYVVSDACPHTSRAAQRPAHPSAGNSFSIMLDCNVTYCELVFLLRLFISSLFTERILMLSLVFTSSSLAPLSYFHILFLLRYLNFLVFHFINFIPLTPLPLQLNFSRSFPSVDGRASPSFHFTVPSLRPSTFLRAAS